MAGKTIEDILIDKDYKRVGKINKKQNQGNKKNIFLIIFLGLLIIALGVIGYFALKYIEDSKVVTSEEFFLKYVLNNNLNSITENKLYEESYKKLGQENFYMDTTLNFSTTSEIEGFENFDFSKFSLDNHLVRNASNQKVYTDSIVKYLGNDIFDLRTVSVSNNFAINSKEIVTKYISGNNDQMNNMMKEVTGYDVNVDFGTSIVDDISNSETIGITEKNIKSLEKSFIKKLDEKLEETDVTQKEIIIDNNGNQVPTIAYTAVLDKKDVLDLSRDVINEIKSEKISSELITGYNQKSIFETGERREYSTNPDADLENIIDRSDFLVGEESEEEQEPENVVDESVSGTITSSDVEREDLEFREEVPDETTIGYRPPVTENPNTDNNDNNTNNNTTTTPEQNGEVINVVGPSVNDNNNNNNNNPNTGDNLNNNGGNNNSNNNNNNPTNTVTNTVNQNGGNSGNQNTVTNTTVPNTTTNTTGGGSNISSDITEGGSAIIPIAILNRPVTVTVESGFSRKLLSDIQIIQNPNLTTEEDRLAQEQNREMLKEETEELFSSITNAIESNTQIVNENMNSNINNSMFSLELEVIQTLLFKTKMDLSQDKYEKILDNFYNKIENHVFEKMYVTVYVANDKTLKVIIEDDNKLQIEIDYIDINDAESKFKYLVLSDKETRTGYMIEIYKSQREASCRYEGTISWINEGKIVEKLVATLSSNGTSLGSTLENEVVLKYVKGTEESFQVSIDNSIGFATRDIVELNDVNCLYLNSLSNEEYVAIVNAVKNKTMDVLAEKMTDLDLIDLNTGNDFVNRVQEEAENNRQEENNISKDEARNLIIDRVSILMGEAEAREEEVTLDVVRDLTIEGYEVTSSVTSEEAYIVLNGHEFIINSSFTIIDVN